MTAQRSSANSTTPRTGGPVPTVAHTHVDRSCRVAVDGRRAAKVLTDWGQRIGLTEAEIQVLWCLRGEPAQGLDQTTLARQLAYSTAQISATVEKLRSRGWIEHESAAGDRRRNLWRLSQTGWRTVLEFLQHAVELQCSTTNQDNSTSRGFPREAAA